MCVSKDGPMLELCPGSLVFHCQSTRFSVPNWCLAKHHPKAEPDWCVERTGFFPAQNVACRGAYRLIHIKMNL